MSNAISRRLGRRFTAMGAGAALVAAGLSLGTMSPASAAVTGGILDALGNPLNGSLTIYEKQADGTFTYDDTEYVSSGVLNTFLTDGVYKLEFDTGSYSEFNKDKTDLATADEVTVTGGAADIGQWVVDQPYVVGTVTNAAGRPVSYASVRVSGTQAPADGGPTFTAFTNTNEKGVYKIATSADPLSVDISADGYARTTVTPITGTGAGTAVNATLTSGGSISGRVTSDAGAPLEFVTVVADGQYDYTDKNGVYTIKHVAAGSHQVYFDDPIEEYLGERWDNSTYTSGSVAPTPVAVAPDQAVGNINAALTPAPADPTRTVEVTGVVKDSLGAPVVGAEVRARTTPAYEVDERTVEYVYSNRQGVFSFTELEKVQGENQFKIYAEAEEQGDDNAFELFGTWFGGTQNDEASPAVTVTPGTPVGAVDFVLDRAGGISGSVTGLAGAPLIPSVSLFGPTDGRFLFSGAEFEADSTFESRSIRPGTYKVRFDDGAGYHAGEWWKDQAKLEDAVEITVKAGQMVGGLNAALGNTLAAKERPAIDGYPWVGKPIAADSGQWNLQTGTAFKYQWLVGSTVVGTGDSFTPSTALIGDRLTLRVTAENGRLVGTATSAASAKIGYQPKIKVKVKGSKADLKIKASPVKAKKIKGKVIVKEIVKVKDDGTIKYKKIGKAKIKKGKGTVSLSKLKKGKHKLVFFFTGKGKVGSNEVAKKVKVKR